MLIRTILNQRIQTLIKHVFLSNYFYELLMSLLCTIYNMGGRVVHHRDVNML